MSKKVNLVIPIDKKLKKDTEKIFKSLGLDLPTAINVFLHQARDHDGFPFRIEREKPNWDTLRAMFDAEDMGLEGGPEAQNLEVKQALSELKRRSKAHPAK